MAPKAKRIQSSVPGLQIRGNSYWFRKMVKGEHIQRVIGRVDEMELLEAEQQCLQLVQDVRSQGKFAVVRCKGRCWHAQSKDKPATNTETCRQ